MTQVGCKLPHYPSVYSHHLFGKMGRLTKMSNVTNQDLSKAFDLIEQDRLSEARSMLEPLLASNQDNADVWWIYAHAVDDEAKAQEALDNVLRIDPAYSGASDLQQTLRQISTSSEMGDEFDDFDLDDEVATPAASRKLTSLSNADDFSDLDTASKATQFDDDDLDIEGLFDDDDLDRVNYDKEKAKEDTSRRGAILALAFAAALVLLLVFVFVIINPFGDNDEQDTTPVPTNVAQSNQVTAESAIGGTGSTMTSEGTEAIVIVVETPSFEPTLEEVAETAEALAEDATVETRPSLTATQEELPTEISTLATSVPTIEIIVSTSTTQAVSTDDSGIIEAATATVIEPTASPEPTATNILMPPTVPPTSDPNANFDALYSALGNLEIVENSAGIVETPLGRTLLVSVCSQSGTILRDNLSQSMYILARESRIFTSEADSVGVRLINCADNTTLSVIAVDINDAIGFSDGNFTEEEFRGRWRAIG